MRQLLEFIPSEAGVFTCPGRHANCFIAYDGSKGNACLRANWVMVPTLRLVLYLYSRITKHPCRNYIHHFSVKVKHFVCRVSYFSFIRFGKYSDWQT